MVTVSTSLAAQQARTPFHVMAKPIGAQCNLRCRYCYYLEKAQLYQDQSRQRMPDAMLERYVQAQIAASPGDEIPFAWQGGEPTLMGKAFFRKVIALQERYRPAGTRISNALQTNGTLLDDDWCRLFKEHGFLVGVSCDGPPELHDHYRVDRGDRPSSTLVLRGIDALRRHGVEYNILCTVNRRNAAHPRRVYRYLRELGSPFLQFIPIVERLRADGSPAGPPQDEPEAELAPWSVTGEGYGDFLCGVFDQWLQRDVGSVFVQLFDVQLAVHLGLPPALCIFSETCGRGLALEHNGDLYACDHYVYPEYRLGRIDDEQLAQLVDSPQQEAFGRGKHEGLPQQCHRCPALQQCWGGCPKHRFATSVDGEPGLNHLCPGYRRFFAHSAPALRRMAELHRAGLPPAQIMHERAAAAQHFQRVGRNQPCPCGSGRKFKLCHGRRHG